MELKSIQWFIVCDFLQPFSDNRGIRSFRPKTRSPVVKVGFKHQIYKSVIAHDVYLSFHTSTAEPKTTRRARYFSTFFTSTVPSERVFGWFKLVHYELRVTCSWSLLTGVLGYRSVCRVNSFDCRLSTRCCNSAFSTKNLHSLSRNWRSSSPICLRWLISSFFDESVAEYKNLYAIEDADNTVSSRSRIASGKSRFNRNFHK